VVYYAQGGKLVYYIEHGIPTIARLSTEFAEDLWKNRAIIAVGNNVKEVAEAITKILEDDSLYLQLVYSCHKYINETKNNMTEEIEKLFQG
jgi:glycosyltransferase involved in cell wall biosynthesis